MCEQTEISYLDGDVVWVKLGSCWWPGEVVATEKLPPDVLPSFRKPPIAVVKFFQEDTYEYVKNINSIYKYNCSRKNEFITKGLYMYRTKHGPMEKFPEDVIRAETAVGGDIEILKRDEFQETKKESYAGLFGEPKKTPISTKKGRGKTRLSESPKVNTPTRKIKEKTDYKVHILVQKSNTPNSQSTDVTSNPSTSCADSEAQDDQNGNTNAGENESQPRTPEKLQEEVKPASSFSTPTVSSSGMYSCHACSFSTTRLNVLILHSKTHSVTFMPYTPSPTKKKPTKASVKSTSSSSKTPKTPRPKKEKSEKIPKKSSQGQKRAGEEPKSKSDVKKPKTEHEIKSSLLADWDDVDEESNDESPSMVMAGSPEVAVAAESPAVPTSAELPSAQVPTEITVEIISPVEKKSNQLPATEKPESSSDSKYEFCEDEDWPVEADGGRKIPRVKKNPSKRKDEAKSLSIDDDEMAREIAELLNKTSVPELPAVPEPLKIEENFPEPSIVKSPDKQDTKSPERPKRPEKASETPPTKAIFKTKTFFRSRHSRSQDAIGKYVAEQLNAVERMDMSEADINGSDAVSSPETRESPPIEPIKVARLAPKIQLKKMKAEAAQLKEKERHDMGLLQNNIFKTAGVVLENTTSVRKPDIAPILQSIPILENITAADESKENSKKPSASNLKQDVLYPTQEIKPVNEEIPEETIARTATLAVEENLVNNEIVDTIQPKSIEIAVEVTQGFSQPDTNIEEKMEVTNIDVIKKDLEIEEINVTKESDIGEEPYTPMNETTASAVDALLSVSREADRVTRVVSDDLPEDLFEDDNRDIGASNLNGFDETAIMETVSDNAHELEQKDQLPAEIDQQASEEIDQQPTQDILHHPAEDVLEQHTEEIVQQPTEESSQQPAEEIRQQSREVIINELPLENFQEHTEEILHEPPDEILHQQPEEILNQQPEEILHQQPEEILHQQPEEILHQHPEEILHQQPEEILHQQPEEILQQPSEEILLQPVEEISLQPAEEISLQTAEDISLQPAEEILLRTTEEILIQPTEVLLQSTEEISPRQPSEKTMQDPTSEILRQPTEEITIENGLIIDKTSGSSESENVNVQCYQLAGTTEQNLSDLPLGETSTNVEVTSSALIENVSESDLQIAEALINLPATAVQKKGNNQMEVLNIAMRVESTVIDADNQPEIMEVDTEVFEPIAGKQTFKEGLLTKSVLKQDSESVNMRFESELEKNENLTAAQSLVQMSETIDHKINIVETNTSILKTKEVPEKLGSVKQNNGIDSTVSVEQKVALLSKDNSNEPSNCKPTKFETTSSKLLKILEEPCTPKMTKTQPSKQIVMPRKEKILNFDVAKSIFKPNKPKSQSPVIIRRAVNKQTLMNNMSEMTTPDKIILSRSNKPSQDGSSVQTYSIQTAPDAPSDSNTITIIQQKVRKVAKPPTKLQKIKPQNSLITPLIEKKISKETNVVEEAMFDINSMPIVLSDDILTPESIEKMPMLMSDGIITNTSNPPKLVKTKQPIVEPEKPVMSTVANKPEIKTLLMNPVSEVNKVATPNILSKSSKLRGAKPMLVIDKATGKQKIIMTKADSAAVKEIIKSAPTLLQPVPQNTGKPEKFIILPSAASPRPGRTQKIVIDPQTRKAHVLVSKGPESSLNLNDNKPVSAKLVPSSSDAASSGNTVMIITNAQGVQSRIVLTPEHEKILFPNKQQPNVSQLKTITHRMTTASATTQKTLISTVPQVKTLVNAVPQLKTQTRIIPKQKNAIITSKGQLIVGGRVASTSQNIAPMPEIRPLQKRIVATEPKKLVQAIQKNTSQQILKTTSQPMQKITSEPLIFLQQKSGTVVQLTASQFEHFQRTGQIIQKIPVPAQEQKIVQKTIAISSGEPLGNVVQKPRIRKTITESPTPAKKVKHEIAIAPAQPHLTLTPMPALTPLSNSGVTTQGPSISNTVSISTTPSYSDLDNFEEMLPSTAIARQQEPAAMAAMAAMAGVAAAEPAPAQVADGQLLAVPGEHFGGPPGSFYLCVEDSGSFTPIDNRPLVLENNQLVPMAVEPLPVLAPQLERRDILEAALANSDVFHAEPPRDEAPDFRDLNANVSVHCCVSETSTTLNQPIMTPVEVPSKTLTEPTVMPTVPTNLEDGLAVIGVTPHTVPTSLELPITVTDPRIAPKTTDPLRGTNYGTSLLTSPNTEMPYMTTEEVNVPMGGPISMPLLTDDEFVGKSMPILTDDIAERPVSSVSSAQDSPGEGEGEAEAEGGWARRLLTPGSDSSETSSEIPLQPSLQLSVGEMSRHS